MKQGLVLSLGALLLAGCASVQDAPLEEPERLLSSTIDLGVAFRRCVG